MKKNRRLSRSAQGAHPATVDNHGGRTYGEAGSWWPDVDGTARRRRSWRPVRPSQPNLRRSRSTPSAGRRQPLWPFSLTSSSTWYDSRGTRRRWSGCRQAAGSRRDFSVQSVSFVYCVRNQYSLLKHAAGANRTLVRVDGKGVPKAHGEGPQRM